MPHFQTTGLYTEKEVDTSQKDDNQASPIPVPERFTDTDWAERIKKAKQAREFGQKLRKGKPASFFSIRGIRR